MLDGKLPKIPSGIVLRIHLQELRASLQGLLCVPGKRGLFSGCEKREERDTDQRRGVGGRVTCNCGGWKGTEIVEGVASEPSRRKPPRFPASLVSSAARAFDRVFLSQRIVLPK